MTNRLDGSRHSVKLLILLTVMVVATHVFLVWLIPSIKQPADTDLDVAFQLHQADVAIMKEDWSKADSCTDRVRKAFEDRSKLLIFISNQEKMDEFRITWEQLRVSIEEQKRLEARQLVAKLRSLWKQFASI